MNNVLAGGPAAPAAVVITDNLLRVLWLVLACRVAVTTEGRGRAIAKLLVWSLAIGLLASIVTNHVTGYIAACVMLGAILLRRQTAKGQPLEHWLTPEQRAWWPNLQDRLADRYAARRLVLQRTGRW
jgi:hypothetical protein